MAKFFRLNRLKGQFFLVAAVILGTMLLSYGSFIATESPPSSIVVDSSNPRIQPGTNYLVIDNANLNNAGNSWFQPSGYDYGVFITNSSSQSLTVSVSYDLSGKKHNIGRYSVDANSNKTIHVTNAAEHVFYLDYSSANGVVSGKVSVQAFEPLS
ncbi:hypothetical protein [Paenibacillus sp. Marseille-Q7038]